MARGTGLPSPTEDVLAQAASARSVQDGDRFSSASAWSSIARTGSRLAGAALSEIQRANHQAQTAYLADQEVEIDKTKAEMRHKYAFDPKGFEADWQAYTEGKLGSVEPWAVDHLKIRLAKEGSSGFTAILGERRRRDHSNDRRSMRARIEMAELSAVEAMVEGGPEAGAAALTEYRAVLEAGTQSGLVTQDEADLAVKKLQLRAKEKVRSRDITTRQQMRDDVASIRSTGQGLDIDPERVRSVVTDRQYADWLGDRRDAQVTHEAVSELPSLTIEGMEDRLRGLEPEAGSEGFARQEKIFEEVAREADRLIKLRQVDPAAAVASLPEVADANEAAAGREPEAVQNAVKLRLNAQGSLGVPDYEQRPITINEARTLAAEIKSAGRLTGRDEVGPKELEAVEKTVDYVMQTYGPYAETVLDMVAEETVKDRTIAPLMRQYLRTLTQGDTPRQAASEAVERASEASEAERAMRIMDEIAVEFGTNAPPPEAPRLPPMSAIQALIARPELADQFDAKYGSGAAARILSGPVDPPEEDNAGS